MPNLAIIGSGITGAITSYILKQRLPQIKVTIFEKAKGIGGRMSTSRNPHAETCTVDLGAQYFTKTCNLSETQERCYENLLNEGLLKPFNGLIEGMRPNSDNLMHYVSSSGSGSVVKYFIQKADPQVYFGKRIVEIIAPKKNQWILKTQNSTEDNFDIIVFTIPVPQILQIKGINKCMHDEQSENMKKVKYNSRYALGLFYNETVQNFNNIPWVAKYITDNATLRFLSLDHKKRSMSSSLPSLVVHSTKEFGHEHIEDSFDEVQELLLEEVNKTIPNLPTPSHIKCHKWRFSQVDEPYYNQPGCITLSRWPLLICGGDGFSRSTFEGCILSAEKIFQAINENLQDNE